MAYNMETLGAILLMMSYFPAHKEGAGGVCRLPWFRIEMFTH